MAKTVKSFKNYDFENCDVDPKYWGDYPHANFFKGEFLPIAKKEFKSLAKKLGAELTFSVLLSSKSQTSVFMYTLAMFAMTTDGMTVYFIVLPKTKKITVVVQTATVLTTSWNQK